MGRRNPTEVERERRNDPYAYNRGRGYRKARQETPETTSLVTFVGEVTNQQPFEDEDEMQYGPNVILIGDRNQ